MNYARRVMSAVAMQAILVNACFGATQSTAVKNQVPTPPPKAFDSTKIPVTLPDGTVYQIPAKYFYSSPGSAPIQTDIFYLLLELPDFKPQNPENWFKLHYGTGKDTGRMSILIEWKKDPHDGLGYVARWRLKYSSQAEAFDGPDGMKGYRFAWPGNISPYGHPFESILVKSTESGVERIIGCTKESPKRIPKCEDWFVHGKLVVKLHYHKQYFENWNTIETNVKNLLDDFRVEY